jgi:hypothetical protein
MGRFPRITRAVAAAAIVVSAVAVTGVSGVGAQADPTASFEVGAPGNVVYTFVASPGASGGHAVLLLPAPATCPGAFGGSTGFSVSFGVGTEDLTLTFASGSEVKDRSNSEAPVPLPDGRYQFCAFWESNFGSAASLAQLEAQIGVSPDDAVPPTPLASLELGSAGTVDYTFDPNGRDDVQSIVLIFEAAAECPDAYLPPPTTGYYFGGRAPEELAYTFTSGSEVLNLSNSQLVPLPAGGYQFCAYWASRDNGAGTFLDELEAEIGVPNPTTTTTASPAVPAAVPATPRYTG